MVGNCFRHHRVWLILFLFLFAGGPLFSQNRRVGHDHEFGFWFGATNPRPGTAADELLDSSIGGGAFYRVDWPWVLYTEIGASYATYDSLTTQKVSLTPVYASLAYQLPIASRFQVFMKGGAGAAQVEIRPQNKSGWEPMAFAGLEFSILASRHFRIGLRLDYYYVYEMNLVQPQDQRYALYYNLLNRPSDQPLDLRFYDFQEGYTRRNGEFMNFGLMMSFIL